MSLLTPAEQHAYDLTKAKRDFFGLGLICGGIGGWVFALLLAWLR